MVSPNQALSTLPDGLREPLLAEYDSIVRNFIEHRWAPSELSGGKFCEIVFSILEGHAKSSYPAAPIKPPSFVQACKGLENHSGSPRSFQILIPRLLPALYEIRNNRGVAHVGGDVDPNHMDASMVVSMSSWVMAELVRVFHGLGIAEAQQLVDSLVERRIPIVWELEGMKRVTAPGLHIQDQITVLVYSCPSGATIEELLMWTRCEDHVYFKILLNELDKSCQIHYSPETGSVHILPLGQKYVERRWIRQP
jgi:hypothetical protein